MRYIKRRADMFIPDFKEVLKLSEKYNVVPIYKEMLADLETPLSAYMKIDNPQYSFLLESIEGGEKMARYSFLGRDPFKTIAYYEGAVHVNEGGKKSKIKTKDPLGFMKKEFSSFKAAPAPGLPRFHGGAVGYIGYDVVKLYEKVPHENKKDDLKWPDMFFMMTDVVLVFDHVYHRIMVVVNIFVNEKEGKTGLEKRYKKALATIDSVIKSMKKPLKYTPLKKHTGPQKVKYHTREKEFKRWVAGAVDEINNGEAIQTVISQRFSVNYNGDPLMIYRALRTVNPSPYMHYIRMGNKHIIGASPEVMTRMETGSAMVRPIAGTRPRGVDAVEDKANEEELLSDEKERAEHLMLIDLGRNDVGRIAQPGTVKVEDLMVIERYSHVMHIVSSVTGRVKKGLDAFDVIKATYPAGTVSGAPKVRAMQMIDAYETSKRGPYSGLVGYVSFSGNLDSCISIRTLYYDGLQKRAYMQAGAGIVADSKPDTEYKETINKAKAVFSAVKKASEMEG